MHQTTSQDENTKEFSVRIRALRKYTGLTQEKFAARIGIQRNTYTNYELGRNYPSDSAIHAICLEYGVRETWLRTGEGGMLRDRTEEEKIQEWVQKVFSSEDALFQQRCLNMLCELPPEMWDRLIIYAKYLLGESPGMGMAELEPGGSEGENGRGE